MERKKLIKLVTLAQNGDHKAVDTLFNAYYNDVYYFALKTVKDDETACEVTQDTFVSILKNFKDLKEPAAFVTWMKQIAYNHCARFFQKRKDVLVDEDEEGNTIFDALPEERTEFVPDEALDQEDFRKTIMGMLDNLSPEQRSATMLYYYNEMSVKQIAQIQGVSEGTVKSRLNYARKAIKKSVEDYEKKNEVKLHSVALLPLLFWLFAGSKEEMATAAVPVVVGEISSATGIALTAGGMSSTATGVAAASTGGIVAKLAGVPLVAKIIAGVTAISLVVGCISVAVLKDDEKPVAVTEPICQHKWVDADCTTPKSCSLCGATEGAALGHKWQDASCEAPKTCSVCSQTDGEALGHTWTDANYQAPKTCSVCNATDGEPLTPDFEKLGIDVITVEMGVEYEYIATCSEKTSKKTVGKVVFTNHHVFESDENHEPADGYQWHTVEYAITFNDDNAWDYGTSLRTGYANYYRTGTSFDHSNADTKHFSVNYNGVERDQCMMQKGDIHFDGWVGRTCTYTCNTSWRVPSGYDGYIFILYDYFTEWEEGQHFYEFMDENTLYFRFDNSTAQEPGTDIPEQDDIPMTEPPVTEPSDSEKVTPVYYVPEGAIFITSVGVEYEAGTAMPAILNTDDRLVTTDYTYSFMASDSPYKEGDWVVRVNDRTQATYPPILERIHGIALTNMSWTFSGCKELVSPPPFPSTVTSLVETFSGCTSLTKAPVIPDHITYLSGTFSYCTSLHTAPEIPQSVTWMEGVFEGCTGLSEFPKIHDGVISLEETFRGCTGLVVPPEIPSSVEVMNGTFQGCTGLTTAPVLPKGVRDLSYAFSGCSALIQAPVIPEGTLNMDYTFSGCSALKKAPEIPESVTSMNGTFRGCSSLTQAPILPAKLTSMYGVFSQCSMLQTAPVIPQGVEDLSWAFQDCVSLIESPVIPSSVTELVGAFSGCSSLTHAPALPVGISDLTALFENCISLQTAPVIPEGVKNMDGTFLGCSALVAAPAIPDGVGSMSWTFSGCTSMTQAADIPKSVECMLSTFRDCSAMEGILVIHASLSETFLFDGCFTGTVNEIILTGSCDNLAELAATAENGNVTVG